MDKLQYDSFYKFMVSVGIVLIVAPLAGLYYLLYNGNQVLISQTEYDALTPNSQSFVLLRDSSVQFILRVLPWFLIVLILIGLGCLIYGSVKWLRMQRELDEQTKLKTQEQKLGIRKLTSLEVVGKTIEKYSNNCGSNTFSGNTNKKQIMLHAIIQDEKHRLSNAIIIESQCYSYIVDKLSKEYEIYQNVRVGSRDYDIIAMSEKHNIDLLFEIKIIRDEMNEYLSDSILLQLINMGEEYESSIHRNWRSILFIVASDKYYEYASNRWTSFINEYKKKTSNYHNQLEIQVVRECDLNKMIDRTYN